MKKIIYIISFIFLGILLQQIIHTVIEIWYIKLLINNFDRYGLGLPWNNWFSIHRIYSVILLTAGILFGYWQGKYWWPKLYDKNGRVRYPRPWRI